MELDIGVVEQAIHDGQSALNDMALPLGIYKADKVRGGSIEKPLDAADKAQLLTEGRDALTILEAAAVILRSELGT